MDEFCWKPDPCGRTCPACQQRGVEPPTPLEVLVSQGPHDGVVVLGVRCPVLHTLQLHTSIGECPECGGRGYDLKDVLASSDAKDVRRSGIQSGDMATWRQKHPCTLCMGTGVVMADG